LNPVQDSKLAIKQIRILLIKPLLPFFASFAAIARPTSWHEISCYSGATFMARLDVI
jgi:hypothetical protein